MVKSSVLGVATNTARLGCAPAVAPAGRGERVAVDAKLPEMDGRVREGVRVERHMAKPAAQRDSKNRRAGSRY
jgi:hypothetical protein